VPLDTSTGGSGSGFLASTAGLLVLAVLVVLALSVPTFRSALTDHVAQFRAYFFGPDATAGTEPSSGENDDTELTQVQDALAHDSGASQRASDRESFDFDLSVFESLFGGPVDGPPQDQQALERTDAQHQ
jgi:hypothetical protein